MRTARMFVLLVLGAMASAPAAAEEVQLVTTNGLFDFRGELLAFDGARYTLRSSLGTLTFPADEVTCVGAACPDVNEVASAFKIAGGPLVQRLLVPELLDAYSLGVDTDISRGTTADGNALYELLSYQGESIVDVELVERDGAAAFADLARGEASLVFSHRQASAEEAAEITGRDAAALHRLKLERILALDAIAVTTGAQAGVDALSPDQLAAILSGDIRNWSEVGGSDLPISVFTREEGADLREIIDTLLLRPRDAAFRDDVIALDSDESLNAAVATFPNSIGFTDLGAIVDRDPLPILDACGTAVPPTAFTVKTGEYPLGSAVYVYAAKGDISVHARGMVDFAQTSAGQEILALAGYIDLRPEAGPDRLPAPDWAGDEARRLSTTFRLREGTEPLDARDRLELEFLADYVRSGRAEGEELLFVSHGEDGPAAARELLSLLFASYPDIEERLTVGFRALPADAAATAPCGADAGITVQIWSRPLAEG
ncbi:hypothetical protein GE300_01885 [Rhodobacteraceae bacterium 2CG4]|uniref:PBP domain-containing protein n=1 Tax=Halovulum marinum TaxID=2662447 RepID=A0A6L5YWY0_9RHOB|nr:substrate-binding domain-containing protein [Halovulum marinum]MSU88365.1 hypothetical protein [Halovulum marinum]